MAERPGSGDRRFLIVNADDYGLTRGVAEGILRAGDLGVVTSTSVLAVAPAFGATVPALRQSGLGVGCHVALVGEDPLLLGRAEVPTLVDRNGRPATSWRTFLRRAARGSVDPEDMRREASAQLTACRDAGLVVDHLDTHQHLHLWPAVGEVITRLALDMGIPAMRLPRARRGLQACGVRPLARRLAKVADTAGVVVPDRFAGLDGAGHLGIPGMVRAVQAMAESGARSAELAVHPGMGSDPERSRYQWGYDWPGELEALCDPRLREAIARSGFHLATFTDLA
ncbi:MAG: carbohydrate deacetylase [Actinomycetes bacterium]